MVGRYRNPKGINFPNEPIVLDPDKINFDDIISKKGEYIYVLAHQPGIGKTYSVMKYLEYRIPRDEGFRFFYFTDRHEAIRERLKDWDKDSYSHWIGFDKLCSNRTNKMLYNRFHLNPSELCKHCRKTKSCQYPNQFNNNQRVFAPFNYLKFNPYKDNPPEVLFLDESIKQFDSYSTDYEKAKQVFNAIEMSGISESIDKKDWKGLSVDGLPEMVMESFTYYVVIALGEDNQELLQTLEGFNLYDFFQYIRWNNIYGYNLKKYGVPSYYYGAFEAVTQGIPAIFMDATFNPYFFLYLLESFNAEIKNFRKKGFKDLNVVVFNKYHKNKDTTIYRMRPTYAMPKSSFKSGDHWNHTRRWLSDDMSMIMNIYTPQDVGIITFKDYADICTTFGFDVEYFGNLRGSNILEEKPVLVVIGTYLPKVASWDSDTVNEKEEYYEDLLRKYFLIEVNKNDLKSVEIGAPRDVEESFPFKLARIKAYQYVGKVGKMYGSLGDLVVKRPAETLNIIEWYNEIYQAFHRNRGLRYKREIFSYCWFPEPQSLIFTKERKKDKMKLFSQNLRDEFNGQIKKIKDEEAIDFFNRLKELNKDGRLVKIMNYVRRQERPSAVEIATRFKQFKKGDKRGLDTKPITWLIKSIKKIRDDTKEKE